MLEHYDEEFESFRWRPNGEPGDWEPCHCACHRSFRCGMPRMMHVMPCCIGGWKKTFQLIAKEMAAYQAEEMRKRQTAITYRPAHGGYPG
jgi:hypothetical protein